MLNCRPYENQYVDTYIVEYEDIWTAAPAARERERERARAREGARERQHGHLECM
jgi:hypothetical protein